MAKLKELKEKRATIYQQIDELRIAAEGREMTSEEQKSWDNLFEEYQKIDNLVQKEEKFQEIETRQLQQSYQTAISQTQKHNTENDEYRTAFLDYLHHGVNINKDSRSVIENRAGISGLSGGVIVPKTLADKIEVALKSSGGMFIAGEVFHTSDGGDLVMPTINDSDNKAVVVSEYDRSDKRAPAFGSVTMKAFTYRTPIIPTSQELIQDSDFDLDTLLAQLMSESFYRGANADLTNGNGNTAPQGIVTAAHLCSVKADATGITTDNLIDMLKELDSNYHANAKWMFNTATYWELRKLKDATGRYLWQDMPTGNEPARLFGKEYVINDDMDDIGAGKVSVLLGNFSKYKIRMVAGFRVIRLNELLAEYLSVGLMGFARLDGRLLDAGTHPILKLQHKAS